MNNLILGLSSLLLITACTAQSGYNPYVHSHAQAGTYHRHHGYPNHQGSYASHSARRTIHGHNSPRIIVPQNNHSHGHNQVVVPQNNHTHGHNQIPQNNHGHAQGRTIVPSNTHGYASNGSSVKTHPSEAKQQNNTVHAHR